MNLPLLTRAPSYAKNVDKGPFPTVTAAGW
jgi:hypothetical protein